MRFLNNSYKAEFFYYAYGATMFFLVYFGKYNWIAIVLMSLSLLYSFYLYFYYRHVRNAVQEVRYTSLDFSRHVDKFVREHEMEEEQLLSEDCVICMDNFSPCNLPHKLGCACKENYYHKLCIREWLLKSPTCPMCRSDLKSKKMYDDIVVLHLSDIVTT